MKFETLHQSVHEKKRPFKCLECDATFPYKHNLATHIVAVHEKRKPHLCPICGIGFADKSNMSNHVSAVHEGKKRTYKKQEF